MCQAGTITSDASGPGIYISRGAVSAEATRVMGWHPQHCKGASDWGGPLGGTVARTNCTLFV